MHLTQKEIEQFYKLWYALIYGVNKIHKVLPSFNKPVYGTNVDVSQEQFCAIRDEMWNNPQWIDEFLKMHDDGEFTESERAIIYSWRKKFVRSRFVIMKHLAKYSVLMSFGDEKETKLYGALGISDSFKDMCDSYAPIMVDAVLLPFGEKIIFDSFIASYNISFGSGMRASLKDTYDEVKFSNGIITSLADGAVAEVSKPKAAPRNKVPDIMKVKQEEIGALINKFCDEKLNEEYKEVANGVLVKLCRKRPSPLVNGKANTWACGIIYAVGSHNFLFDKSQKLYMKATDIPDWFGLSKNTASGKANEINKMLKIDNFNTDYIIESLKESHPAFFIKRLNRYWG